MVRCPRPYISRFEFSLKLMKISAHRRKDYVLLYVPYEAQHQEAAAWGWGVVLTRKNVIRFCYDIIHQQGCDSYRSPFWSKSDLRKLEITVLRGVLTVKTTAYRP